jgi:hypothetical protein
VTPRDRIALVMDARDNQGDETPVIERTPDGSDPILILRYEVELRLRRIEKQMNAMAETPEMIAALARTSNRKVYG